MTLNPQPIRTIERHTIERNGAILEAPTAALLDVLDRVHATVAERLNRYGLSGMMAGRFVIDTKPGGRCYGHYMPDTTGIRLDRGFVEGAEFDKVVEVLAHEVGHKVLYAAGGSNGYRKGRGPLRLEVEGKFRAVAKREKGQDGGRATARLLEIIANRETVEIADMVFLRAIPGNAAEVAGRFPRFCLCGEDRGAKRIGGTKVPPVTMYGADKDGNVGTFDHVEVHKGVERTVKAMFRLRLNPMEALAGWLRDPKTGMVLAAGERAGVTSDWFPSERSLMDVDEWHAELVAFLVTDRLAEDPAAWLSDWMRRAAA